MAVLSEEEEGDKMIVLIDNYDSFSYNLVQLMGQYNPDIRVIRNDEMTVRQIEALAPSHLILSPGPGYPADAGVCEDVVARLKGKMPILGVCLGHQAICEVFGASIGHARQLMHGKKSCVSIDTEDAIFHGLTKRIEVARYHSLIADMQTMPEELKVLSVDDGGEVMAVRHRDASVYGLQFHPESIMTPDGGTMIRNFLAIK